MQEEEESGTAGAEENSCYLFAQRVEREFRIQKKKEKQPDSKKLGVQEEENSNIC